MDLGNEFELLDDYLLAANSPIQREFELQETPFAALGPSVELSYAIADSESLMSFRQLLPDWLVTSGERSLPGVVGAGDRPSLKPLPREISVVASLESAYSETAPWLGFRKRFDLAAVEAGCTTTQGRALAEAMREMVCNVWDHSCSPATCRVCYQSTNGVFEFCVADLGVGVLDSLRSCSEYRSLDSAAAALAALLQGASRLGSGRGGGYRALFRVLDNASGYVRCRSGNAVLVLDNTVNPTKPPEIHQRPWFQGLAVSVASKR